MPSKKTVSQRNRLLFVGKKSKWICQLCHEPVDPELLGVENHPYAPSLDHIVPVAAGGSNKRSNLQLAHRVCNAEAPKNPKYPYATEEQVLQALSKLKKEVKVVTAS